MKAKIRIGMYAGLLALIWVITGLASAGSRSKTVKEVRVVLDEGRESFFLDGESVKGILAAKNGKALEGNRISELKFSDLEYELDRNPWIGNAELYWQHDSIVTANIELRKPLARVIAANGVSFYLDGKMRKFPVSPRYPADVPMVTGSFREELLPEDTLKSEQLKGVSELLGEISSSDFFSSLVSEIVIDEKGEVTIFPEVGDLRIRIGKPVNVKAKLNGLMKFYDQVLSVTGWERYKSVDLSYEGQIVGRKNFNW